MSRGGFICVTATHLHMPGLTHTEGLLLARIASFGVFFESPANTAKFLNRAEKTIQTCRQALVRAGYIFELEDTGRGKKYIARADLRMHELTKKDLKAIEKIKEKASMSGKPLNIPPHFLDKADAEQKFSTYIEEPEEEEIEEQAPINPLRPSKGKKVHRMTDTEKENRSAESWNKAHPDLVPVLKQGVEYLKAHGIPIYNWYSFRKNLTITSEALKHPDYPQQHLYMFSEYFKYIASEPYLYQLDHNRYAPRVVEADDLWKKLLKIREFARDKGRHYDPSKVLTH